MKKAVKKLQTRRKELRTQLTDEFENGLNEGVDFIGGSGTTEYNEIRQELKLIKSTLDYLFKLDTGLIRSNFTQGWIAGKDN
tara:strand:- start:48 stop:293 length:246 start_codon:yes stop_codon:yes gene_type:complete